MIYALLALLAWAITPMLVLAFLPIPPRHRLLGALSFAQAAVKGWLVLPAVLVSPIVVPIALLFTPREANELPAWARWWDNDVSINGDRPDLTEAYYAPGYDVRSYWARFVWLVGRNRASWLAQELGYRYRLGDQVDRDTWGDALTGRDHEGWTVNRCAGVYQLYIVKRLGARLCLRVNVGHKIWAGYDLRPVAMVVNITASLMSWEGAA